MRYRHVTIRYASKMYSIVKYSTLDNEWQDKCGMRASMTAELVFQDCRVPAGNLVGDEGKATLCMMRNLEIERVSLPSFALF